MRHHIEQHLYTFLKKELSKEGGSLLLGLSGGPDSSALFYLLKEFHQVFNYKIIVAHIDHNWREESKEEALLLKKMVEQEKIAFFLKTLDSQKIKGNREDAFREERYRFFQEIYKKEKCQAVILGHHADDQAETVLKRVLEGAALHHLSGIQEVSKRYEMTLWRPFAKVTKKTICNWLEGKGIKTFHDKTNNDEAYLRARMRKSIIPSLAESFGKEIQRSLCQIGEEAQELQNYLETKLLPYLQKIEGGVLNLEEEKLFPIEQKFLVRRFCKYEKVSPTRDQLEKICLALSQKNVGKRFIINGKEVIASKGKLFVAK